jgi:hypothetical protein
MYLLAQCALIGVAIYFWRRYPRPSFYLASMAMLELAGSLMQTGIQFTISWRWLPIDNALLVQVIASMIRFGAHVFAMCFLVAAVYVARQQRATVPSDNSLPSETPGMEGQDQAFSLDPSNPYAAPRLPR